MISLSYNATRIFANIILDFSTIYFLNSQKILSKFFSQKDTNIIILNNRYDLILIKSLIKITISSIKYFLKYFSATIYSNNQMIHLLILI
jgi:hypothetical protein